MSLRRLDLPDVPLPQPNIRDRAMAAAIQNAALKWPKSFGTEPGQGGDASVEYGGVESSGAISRVRYVMSFIE